MIHRILQAESKIGYEAKIRFILEDKKMDRTLLLKFALYCAEDLDKYYDIKKYSDLYNKRIKCLDLLGSYILDNSSVTKEQLNAAAYAAYAANAAYATSAANAANAAAYAAYAASASAAADYAAYAAAYAAYAAYAAAAKNFDEVKETDLKETDLKEKYMYLINMITNNKLVLIAVGV